MSVTLKVEDLEIKYRTQQATLTAIRGLNFEVKRGQIVGLVGESGCGKSTIASALMRLLPPNGEISGGRLLFNGEDLIGKSEGEMRHLRGRDIAMIFQDPMTSLNPVFNIEEQMVDAILSHGVAGGVTRRSEARELAVQMLTRVGIPDAAQRIQSYPHQFSGGMRQRIMIASALQTNPALLIADEPTSALDVTLEAQIISLIRGLRDELNTSILYITHDLGVVAELCDQVVVLYAGSMSENGDVFEIFKRPLHPYTRALLRSHPSANAAHTDQIDRLVTIPGRVPSLRDLPRGCKFAPRCELAQAVCFEIEPEPVIIGTQTVFCHAYQPDWPGRRVETSPLTAAPRSRKPRAEREDETGRAVSVQAEQLEVHFKDPGGWLMNLLGEPAGKIRAVDGVTLDIYAGESLAVVGESGSGKTTLGKAILRLEKPTSGEVAVEGVDITASPQAAIRPMRAKMQMIFQDPISSLSPRKTVAQLLMEPFQIHGVAADPAVKVDELLEMVGLSSEQAGKYPHQLSGGQARRVGIARALALRPALLIADEPTAGLDVSVAAGILNLMKDLREKLGLTYMIITHNLSIIGFIADRVAVMYLGKLMEIGETEILFNRSRHPYTYALMSSVSIPDPSLRETRQRAPLEGEIPSPRNPPTGCPFHPRCRFREERCVREMPELRPGENATHWVACHFPERVGEYREAQRRKLLKTE